MQSDKNPVSAYTGRELPKDGGMHLDHVISAKEIETSSRTNLFMSAEERVAMANQDANLRPCESRINQSMQDKDKRKWVDQERKADRGKTNAQPFDVDRELLEKTVKDAESAVNADLLKAQLKKQGTELLQTGAKEAGKNAIRQAIGVLLYELVNGMFVEMKHILKTPKDGSLVERLIASLKKVAARVRAKLKTAFSAGVSGGILGFVSNLLTFLINSVVTTSAKVVTAIREGMTGIWQAIKLLANPPENMTTMDVSRQVTKILAGVVTASLGLLFEESIKGFLISIPFLAPLAGTIAPAVTAVLTGLATALVVYGLDTFFDWLSVKGTELLQAFESNMAAIQQNIQHMASWIESQYENSVLYQQIGQGYLLIEADLQNSSGAYRKVSQSLTKSSEHQNKTIKQLESGYEKMRDNGEQLLNLLDNYQLTSEKH